MSRIAKFPTNRYNAGQPSPYHENPPRSQSPDSEYSTAHRGLTDWARHLADNSSVITAVLSSRVSNAIGSGLTYEPLVRDRKGNLVPEINDAFRRVHEQWSRSADVTGELTRQEIERVMWRGWDLDGESFARRVNKRMTRDRNEIPYKLQIMRSDWVPANLTGTFKERRIVHGIQKDEWGRPLAYYVEPNVTDFTLYASYIDPDKLIRLPAEQVWHLKRTESAGQTRGVTLLHAVIFRVADIAEYQESHRLAARATADLFASINRSTDFGEDLSSDETETDADGNTKRTWDFEHLQMIDGLGRGESVNFHSPQHPNQNAVDFIREELRQIAASCDIGFSQVAQVFDSSYAAQRLEVVDVWRKTERDRSKFITDFARSALYEEVIETARLAGKFPARLLRKADPETLLDVRISGPTMPVIDPVKDRTAFEKDQQNGWDSRQGIIRQLGRQPRDIDAEVQGDELLQKLNEMTNPPPPPPAPEPVQLPGNDDE